VTAALQSGHGAVMPICARVAGDVLTAAWTREPEKEKRNECLVGVSASYYTPMVMPQRKNLFRICCEMGKRSRFTRGEPTRPRSENQSDIL